MESSEDPNDSEEESYTAQGEEGNEEESNTDRAAQTTTEEEAEMSQTTYGEFKKEYEARSQVLSKTSRTTALGIIAGLWAILVTERIHLGDAAFGIPVSQLVKAAFVAAAGALLLDLLQNIAAFWMYNVGLDRADARASEGKKAEDLGYTKEHLGRFGVALYWTSVILFPLKLILSLAGGGAFVLVAFTITV